MKIQGITKIIMIYLLVGLGDIDEKTVAIVKFYVSPYW